MADDWDLYAVVRSCTSLATTTTATASTTTTTTNPINGSNIEKDESFPSLNSLTFQNNDYVPSILDDRNDSFQELNEIYKVFYGNPVTYTTMAANTNINTTTSISVAEEFQDKPQPQWPRQVQPKQQQQQQQQVVQREQNVQFKNAQIFEPSSITFPIASPQPIQPRRRKNQQTKMVHQMTQEELTADSWTWRKYGQKPIKGSPYPRNYYRCSTAKGCAARKQVERSPTDANIYIVSYTGEHTHPRPTHRSSLTGSTRNKSSQAKAIKPVSSDHAATSRNNTSLVAANPKASCSSASSPASGSSFSPSPNTSLMEDESITEEHIQEGNDIEMQKGDDHEDHKDILIANEFMMSEDIFKGFQENGAAGVGDDLSCSLLSPPWTPSCSAATKGNFTGEGGG